MINKLLLGTGPDYPTEYENFIDLLKGIAVFMEHVVSLWERSPVGVCISVAILPLALFCLIGLGFLPWLFKAKVPQKGKRETLEETRRSDKIDTRTGERTIETEQRRFTKIG